MNTIALIAFAIIAADNTTDIAADGGAADGDAVNGGAVKRASQLQFHRDVVPILTKAGCNGGGCHGAAAGRGGFHLSLYGSDPLVDFRSIVREMKGRRVNLARPAESLILLKPTGQLDHEGDFRFDEESQSAKILRAWISQGAEQGTTAKVTSLKIQPSFHQFANVGQSQQLKAIAQFADGSSKDVTSWTVFRSSDPSALAIDDRQTMTSRRRGWHVATARFLDQVVAIETILPWRDKTIEAKNHSQKNFVDIRVDQRLEALKVPASGPASDNQFLRRVFLDLTGRLPTPQQVLRFANDRHPEKDSQLIDDLVQSDAFVEYWTHWTANLLRIHSNSPDKTGIRVYHDWVEQQWRKTTPYNEVVSQLVTSLGDSHKLGPPNFYRSANDARGQAELVSEVFLGVRLRCANCHDHPLDHWKQDDYHGLAAIFAKIERGQTVKLSASGEVTHPRTGDAAIARIPGQSFLAAAPDHRTSLANWITSPENPYFSKAITNRIWQHFMGRGLVEPVDDIRDTNPPTHPHLLADLAKNLSDSDFDLRTTIRVICNSAAYRRSSVANKKNEFDKLFYSHMPTKRLSGEVLADIICDVTGKPSTYGNQPLGTRAIQLYDGMTPSKSLDLLGRCSRKESCESGASNSGLSRQLHLINGSLINAKLTARDGHLHKMLDSQLSREQFVQQWYLRCLGRDPRKKELTFWIEQLKTSRDNRDNVSTLEDFVWSLLVCKEFTTNH